ncbi:hypothetical protein AYI70_g844 [Smittium culicis]|uniref:WD repeat-containing protein n=1 Tax=Smittium culicis TaxID=133412 RepID=A0A1R1YF50_9FUNG|nr:hypothetical protein AYI70_g3546 [Smittium culicis]OMJ25519.1 hypothetical protein AYI70_g844 [Smittium culicis]
MSGNRFSFFSKKKSDSSSLNPHHNQPNPPHNPQHSQPNPPHNPHHGQLSHAVDSRSPWNQSLNPNIPNNQYSGNSFSNNGYPKASQNFTNANNSQPNPYQNQPPLINSNRYNSNYSDSPQFNQLRPPPNNYPQQPQSQNYSSQYPNNSFPANSSTVNDFSQPHRISSHIKFTDDLNNFPQNFNDNSPNPNYSTSVQTPNPIYSTNNLSNDSQAIFSDHLPIENHSIQTPNSHTKDFSQKTNLHSQNTSLSKTDVYPSQKRTPSTFSASPITPTASKRFKPLDSPPPQNVDSKILNEVSNYVNKVNSVLASSTTEIESNSAPLLKTIDSVSYNLSSREVAQESAKFLVETCELIEKRAEMLIEAYKDSPSISESSLRQNIESKDRKDNIDASTSSSRPIHSHVQNSNAQIEPSPKSSSHISNEDYSSENDQSDSAKSNLNKPAASKKKSSSISDPKLPSRHKTEIKFSSSNSTIPSSKINIKDFSNSSSLNTKDSLDIVYRAKRDLLYSLQSVPVKNFRRKPRGLIVKELFAMDSSFAMSAITGSLDGSLQFWNVNSRSVLEDGTITFPRKQFPEHLSLVSNNTLCAVLSKTNDDNNSEQHVSKNNPRKNSSSEADSSLALITVDSISDKSVQHSINYIQEDDSSQKRNISVVSPVSGNFYSNDDRIVFATAGHDKRLDLWNIEFDSLKQPFTNGVYPIASCHSSSIQALCFENTRSWLFSGGSDCRFQVTDLSSESVLSNTKYNDRINRPKSTSFFPKACASVWIS